MVVLETFAVCCGRLGETLDIGRSGRRVARVVGGPFRQCTISYTRCQFEGLRSGWDQVGVEIRLPS